MRKIKNVNLTKGRNAEHYTFNDNVLSVFTEEMAAGVKLGQQRAAYAALFAKEEAIFKYRGKEESTEKVAEQDRVRDSIFLHLKQVVEAFKTSPVPEKKAAGEKLSYTIRPYRDANVKAYRENTALIKNLLADLKASDCVGALATLGLADVVELLGKANEEFVALSAERTDTRLVRDSTETMSEIRPQVDAAYQAVADAVNSLYSANELVLHDEAMGRTLAALIDKVNGEVNEFQRALAQRGAGKKADLPAGGGDDSGQDGGEEKPGSGQEGGENPGTGENPGGSTGGSGGDDNPGGSDFD